MIDLDHVLLRTFVTCIDTMSFTRAADIVHKSPATVSTQIARLEERIGTPLFLRDTRNLSLTKAGEELEYHARRILRLHDEAAEAFGRPDMEGAVTIGAPDDYIAHMLPPVLRRFGSLFPRVEINVVCAQTTVLLPQVDKGEIDLAIISRTGGSEGQLIRTEPMVWISAPDRLALERNPLPVALYEQGSQARGFVLQALTRANISFRAAYSSFSHSALLTIVDAGLAVAAVAEMAAPAALTRLGESDGLPAVAPLEIACIRRAGSTGAPVDMLAEAILESGRR